MEISTFTFNAVALVVLCIGNGIPVRTSVPGKSQVVFKGELKLSNLIFSAFAIRQIEIAVGSPRTLKVYLLTIKHKGSP